MKYAISVLVICFSSSMLFANDSVSLKLIGNVPKKLDLEIDTSLATLDLTANRADYKIATIIEKSNSNNGYRIKISSSNQGKLARSGGLEKFDYKIKYGSQVIDLNRAEGANLSNSNYGVLSTANDLLISYSGIPSDRMVEGTYEDTLTFEISAN